MLFLFGRRGSVSFCILIKEIPHRKTKRVNKPTRANSVFISSESIGHSEMKGWRSAAVYKFSLVFKPVTTESQAGRSQRQSVRTQWTEAILCCCCCLSFIQPFLRLSLGFQFLHSSHARSIVPRVSLQTQWPHLLKAVVFKKRKTGFVLKPRKGRCHAWGLTPQLVTAEPEVRCRGSRR